MRPAGVSPAVQAPRGVTYSFARDLAGGAALGRFKLPDPMYVIEAA